MDKFPISLKLIAPANKVELAKCEKAQKYLKWDELPTSIEDAGHHDIAKVWWMYKDTLGDNDFKFFLCIPIYEVWGAKKRKKYLDARK